MGNSNSKDKDAASQAANEGEDKTAVCEGCLGPLDQGTKEDGDHEEICANGDLATTPLLKTHTLAVEQDGLMDNVEQNSESPTGEEAPAKVENEGDKEEKEVEEQHEGGEEKGEEETLRDEKEEEDREVSEVRNAFAAAILGDDRYVENVDAGLPKTTEKLMEAVMRVTIHTIEGITRDTDVGTDPDPFVEIYANRILLGATRPKKDSNTCEVDESFFIKTKTDPQNIKLRFSLKDKDHMDDDVIGHGYFDLGEEDTTNDQIVHLKWKGKEVGVIKISVDFQNVVIV